ncbi:hypothetical protein ABLV94_05755 [Staphylococcus sp. Mo2-7]
MQCCLGVPDSILFESLNQHIVWLMIGAFIISSVIEESGLLTRLVNWFSRKCHTEKRASLFILATIQLMTFFIPSTSSRAASNVTYLSSDKNTVSKACHDVWFNDTYTYFNYDEYDLNWCGKSFNRYRYFRRSNR